MGNYISYHFVDIITFTYAKFNDGLHNLCEVNSVMIYKPYLVVSICWSFCVSKYLKQFLIIQSEEKAKNTSMEHESANIKLFQRKGYVIFTQYTGKLYWLHINKLIDTISMIIYIELSYKYLWDSFLIFTMKIISAEVIINRFLLHT